MKSRLVESNTLRVGAIEAGDAEGRRRQLLHRERALPAHHRARTRASSPSTRAPRPSRSSGSRRSARRATRRRSRRRLADLKAAAKEGRNVMPASIACAHAGVTTGEWGQALREVFGEYRAPTGVAGARTGGPGGRVRAGAAAGRARLAAPGPAAQDPGRQARPGRPQQRRRADRRRGPRLRHGGRLRGHPPHARAHRQRRARGERPPRRPLDPLRLPHAARQGGAAPDARRSASATSRSSSAASSRPRTPASCWPPAWRGSTRPRTTRSTRSWPRSRRSRAGWWRGRPDGAQKALGRPACLSVWFAQSFDLIFASTMKWRSR